MRCSLSEYVILNKRSIPQKHSSIFTHYFVEYLWVATIVWPSLSLQNDYQPGVFVWNLEQMVIRDNEFELNPQV